MPVPRSTPPPSPLRPLAAQHQHCEQRSGDDAGGCDNLLHLRERHPRTCFRCIRSRRGTRRNGGDTLLTPRRYGAIGWRDHARFWLSVFSREEAAAIVGYLRWRADVQPQDRACVESALDDFWLAREREAPTSAQLEAHLAEETGFVRAIEGDRGQGT